MHKIFLFSCIKFSYFHVWKWTFHAWKWYFHAWKLKYCPLHDFFAPEIVMGSWAVHNFINGIFTHENLRENLSFSSSELSFSCMEVPFLPPVPLVIINYFSSSPTDEVDIFPFVPPSSPSYITVKVNYCSSSSRVKVDIIFMSPPPSQVPPVTVSYCSSSSKDEGGIFLIC